MKFQFVAPDSVDFSEWGKCSKRLEEALMELSAETPSEENVRIYLSELVHALRPIQTHSEPMLFLMYDDPAAMPSDARVDFVYRPTYLAAAILMTAMHRFPALWEDTSLRKPAYAVLTAAMGRNFMGSGYEEIDGFLDTLEIFATGDSFVLWKRILIFIRSLPKGLATRSHFWKRIFAAANRKMPGPVLITANVAI